MLSASTQIQKSLCPRANIRRSSPRCYQHIFSKLTAYILVLVLLLCPTPVAPSVLNGRFDGADPVSAAFSCDSIRQQGQPTGPYWLFYNSDFGAAYRAYCNMNVRPAVLMSTDGMVPYAAAKSCNEIHQYFPSDPSGNKWLNPDNPTLTFCQFSDIQFTLDFMCLGGGGGGGGWDLPIASAGASGGIVYGSLIASPLTVLVGGKGQGGYNYRNTAPGGNGGYNGGGRGGTAGRVGYSGGGGGGGGWSGLRSGGLDVAIAGGGGGGGGAKEACGCLNPANGGGSGPQTTGYTGTDGFSLDMPYITDGGGGGGGGGGHSGGLGADRRFSQTCVASGGGNYLSSLVVVTADSPLGKGMAVGVNGGTKALGTNLQRTAAPRVNGQWWTLSPNAGMGGQSGSAAGVSQDKECAGNDGMCVLRYKGAPKAQGGVVSSIGDYTYHTFDASGTYSFTLNQQSQSLSMSVRITS